MNLQLEIKNFDLLIAGAKLTNAQAVQIINYARRIGVDMFQYEPVPTIKTHNLIASYLDKTKLND